MKKILAVAATCLFAGCVPSQFLKKTYTPADLEGKSFLVYPLHVSQVDVVNTEDFRDDFEEVTTEPEAFLDAELDSLAGEYFKAKATKVEVLTLGDSALRPLTPDNSLKLEEKIDKESFEIRVPKPDHLESLGVKPKFILVMDRVVFSREAKTNQNFGAPAATAPGAAVGTGLQMNTSTKKSISVGLNYLIYDYETGETVGYGATAGEKTFQFAMTRSDWYAAMENAMANIRKFSPFKP